MIGKNNIEEKLFDYFEGDLNANEAKELENFVKNNPEYQVDFDAWKQSVVPAVSMQYQHADDLLVNEKSSPKGWLRWASGGVLLCLVSIASVSLVTKYDDSNGFVGELKEDKINQKSKAKTDRNSIESEVLAQSISDSESNLINTNNSSSLVSSNSIESNSVEASAGSVNNNIIQGLEGETLNKNLNSGSNPVLSNNDDQYASPKHNLIKDVLVKEALVEDFNISALKEGAYSYLLPFAMKKDKTPYENPNQPKFFVTNNKDPYLNYNLAHTLEENGGFAGNGGDGIRVEYLYRTEWPSVTTDNFSSQIISADGYVSALKGGLGFIINADRLGHGALNSTAFSLLYSPKFVLGGVSFEPSIKNTIGQRKITWSQIQTNDIKDPRNGVLYGSVPFVPENIPATKLLSYDLGLGMLINAGKFFIGGQVDHINQFEVQHEVFNQSIKMPTKITAMAGTDIYKKKGGKIAFSPSVNYIKFGNYNTIWMNTQLSYQGFFMAAGVATNEELMASLGYKNNLVRLTYGLGFSKPSEFSGLAVSGEFHESHQLSLRVNLSPKR